MSINFAQPIFFSEPVINGLFLMGAGCLVAIIALLRDIDNRLFKARLEAYTKTLNLLTDVKNQIAQNRPRIATDDDEKDVIHTMSSSILLASPELKGAIEQFIDNSNQKDLAATNWRRIISCMRKDLGTDKTNGTPSRTTDK